MTTVIYPAIRDYQNAGNRIQGIMKTLSEVEGIECLYTNVSEGKKPIHEGNLKIVYSNSKYTKKEKEKVIVLSDNPATYIKDMQTYEPDAYIYDAGDGIGLSETVAKNATAVICSSKEALEVLLKIKPASAYLIPNGCFEYEESEDKKNYAWKDSHKVIGFVGSLKPDADMDLIRNLAMLRADYNFVYVTSDSTKAAPSRDNIFYVRPESSNDVMDMMNEFDMFHIPYKENSIAYPEQLTQFLEFGKPIVASSIRAIKSYPMEVIYRPLDHNPLMYASMIDTALHEKHAALLTRRKGIAKENLWNTRKDLLQEVINKC